MAIPQLQFAMGKVIEYYRIETVQFCFCWTGEVSQRCQMNSINSDFSVMYLTGFVGWVLLKCEIFLCITAKAHGILHFHMLCFHGKVLTKVGEQSCYGFCIRKWPM